MWSHLNRKIKFIVAIPLLTALIWGIVLFSYGRIYEFSLKHVKRDSKMIHLIGDTYRQLKDYEFDDLKFDCEANSVVLKSRDRKLCTELQYNGDIQYTAGHILNAKSMYDGIVFAVRYTWDGDWYAYYCSDAPNCTALERLNAVQITDNIFYVFLPAEYV